jgi:putative transposase
MPSFPQNRKSVPMTLADIEDWMAKLSLPQITTNFVRRAVTNPPVRSVGGGGRAVSGRFISRKNETTVDYESKGECKIYSALECDENCLAFFAQAAVLQISYVNIKGVTVETQCTPDALVLTKAGPIFVECKFESTLETLAKEQPNKWVKTEDGRWTCPPAEAAAKEFGIGYEILLAESHQVFARNYEILSDFYLKESPRPPAHVLVAVQTALAANLMAPTTLEELLAKSAASISEIYAMLVEGSLYADLNREPLEKRKLVHVWQSKYHEEVSRRVGFESGAEKSGVPISFSTGSAFTLGGKINRISLITSEHVYFVGENQTETKLGYREFLDLTKSNLIKSHGEVTDDPRVLEGKRRMAAAHPDDIKRALKRLDAINGKVKVPERTRYFWKRQYQEAEVQFNNGFVGLLKQPRRAVTKRKISSRVLELFEQVMEQNFKLPGGANRKVCREELKELCKAEGYRAPSQNWFNLEIRKRDQLEIMQKRYGTGVAYQASAALALYLNDATPTHGDYHMAVGYIDHTQVDVEMKCADTGESLGRPWLTVLAAGHNREVLAFWLSFDPPSSVSVLQVLRQCYKTWGRCPRRLVLDGGKEFHSTEIQTIAAFLVIELCYRPGKKPRFGAIIESLFGSTNVLMFHNLKGNTVIRKNVRAIRPEVDPDNLVHYDLPLLSAMLEVYFFDIHANTEHRSLLMTPSQKRAQSIELHGERRHMLCAYDRTMQILFCPSVSQGTSRVTSKGVTVHYFRYDAPKLVKHRKEDVPVRYDPFDISHVFAFVDDEWVECFCPLIKDLAGRSVCELHLATEILRKKRSEAEKNQTIKYEHIAALLRAANHPELVRQRLMDQNLVPMLKRLTFDYVETPVQKSLPGLSDVEPLPDTTPKAKEPKADAAPAAPKPKLTLAQKLAKRHANPSFRLS